MTNVILLSCVAPDAQIPGHLNKHLAVLLSFEKAREQLTAACHSAAARQHRTADHQLLFCKREFSRAAQHNHPLFVISTSSLLFQSLLLRDITSAQKSRTYRESKPVFSVSFVPGRLARSCTYGITSNRLVHELANESKRISSFIWLSLLYIEKIEMEMLNGFNVLW